MGKSYDLVTLAKKLRVPSSWVLMFHEISRDTMNKMEWKWVCFRDWDWYLFLFKNPANMVRTNQFGALTPANGANVKMSLYWRRNEKDWRAYSTKKCIKNIHESEQNYQKVPDSTKKEFKKFIKITNQLGLAPSRFLRNKIKFLVLLIGFKIITSKKLEALFLFPGSG